MVRTWLVVVIACCLPATLLAYQSKTNKRLNRVSLNELRQVIRDDLIGIVENALVSLQMGRSASGTMTIDEKITTSVEASVRTMGNSIQDTLRRFEARLMTIETRLEGSDVPMARNSRYQERCSEAHERSLQQGVERITAILGSVTERVGEARDASSAAEQGVQRLNDRLPKVEDNIRKELEHSVTVMETGVKRQMQTMQLEAAAAAAARETRPTSPPPRRSAPTATCDGDSLLSAFKRMESSLTWQVNKVENLLTTAAEDGRPLVSRRELLDADAAQQVEPLARSPDMLKSCAELYERGMRVSGLYTIRPGQVKVRVFCDMNSEGGGWTVFQRRGPHLKREDFFRDWEAYKLGFGEPEGEYWLGNLYLHQLTSDGARHRLRIDMLDWGGERTYVQYDNFSIGDEQDKFRIQLGQFTGDIGDSMTMDNGRQFSTADQDNDRLRYGSCARVHKAGWWFGACRRANLNGVAHTGSHEGPDGINWLDWKGPNYSIKATRMMVK